MKKIARLVVRGADENDGLILGVGVRGSITENGPLKPGTVYEIEEILGELVLKEVGPSAVKNDSREYDKKPELHHPGVCWGNDVGLLLGCAEENPFLYSTEQEYHNRIERRRVIGEEIRDLL